MGAAAHSFRRPSLHGNRSCREPTTRQRILVVEDEQTCFLILQAVLEGEGFQVVHAENGARALEILNDDAAEFSLVVTDLLMPEMDGLTFLGHLFRDPALSEVPVLVCTAKDDIEVIREASRRGASGYLDKHFTDRSKLAGTVRKVLRLPPEGG